MQQSRQRVRELRCSARKGNADAARTLLAHSVSLGHERLGVRRYFVARFLGADDLDRFKPFCVAAAHRLPAEAVLASAKNAARDLDRCNGIHVMASELLSPKEPFVLPFDGVRPRFSSVAPRCGDMVSLIGRVEIGANPLFGAGAVVRADGHFVRIGDDFRLGEMSTVHIAHEVYPTIIGHRLTVGRNAVVHACTVGNDCVFEDNVVILDGSTVEDGVVVEAGSIVYPRSTLKAGLLYSGSPAKPIRELESGERDRRELAVYDAIAASLFNVMTGSQGALSQHAMDHISGEVFLAATAQCTGRIEAVSKASVFFGCRLDSGQHQIVICKNSNIQDNTVIDASEGDVHIGENVTIGHNVSIRASRIGNCSLIGIGSSLGAGTIVDEDVLLAAGSVTEPGQHLTRGWLWGGRPARQMSRLDESRRASMSAIVEQYCSYAAVYRVEQSSVMANGGSDGTSAVANRNPNR